MPAAPRFLAVLVLTLALASPALAQSSGTLRGVVTDMAGTPLPGVTITLKSAGHGVSGRGAVTDRAGVFLMAALPPGDDYEIRLSLPGFATVVLSGTGIYAGQVTTQAVVLPPERALREKIEVRASPPLVSLEETATQTRFSSEFVDSLPILGRNYQDVLVLAPGVSDIDGDGNPNIHGARDTDVVTLVDGVSTSDPYSGKIGAQLNIESIQEIEVKTTGASAEFGRAQGGFASVITKSGGNDFEGAFKFYWRGSALDGDGAGIDDPMLHGGIGENGLRDLTFNDFLPFLSAGGPIVKDRAWYYATLEYIAKDDPVNALNAAFVTGLRERRAFGKATWQVSPSSRLSLSLNYDPQTYLNQGLNSFTLEETAFTERAGGTNITLKGVSVLSPSVVLDSSLSRFQSRPEVVANLGLDTNGNGILYADRDGNGFIDAKERDAGQDYDGDGAWDIWEDTHVRNGKIDTWEEKDPNNPFSTIDVTEDKDGDKVLTPRLGCEGALREDLDCDGRLDNQVEDKNNNGVLDPGEDYDFDHRLDPGTEDRNGDGVLNDWPFPTGAYPYGSLRPLPVDRDFLLDEKTGVISGPFYEELEDTRRRVSLREDLSVFVADFKGSHDLRTGVVLERESFGRETSRHSITALQPPVAPVCDDEGGCIGGRPESLVTLLPSDLSVASEASGTTGAIYVQDTWKPSPNLSLGLGVRFERESVGSSGYSTFDPRAERATFNRLAALSGGEVGVDDLAVGNGDGLANLGILQDPFFLSTTGLAMARSTYIDPLRLQAIRRLTRHRSNLGFTVGGMADLFPDIIVNGQLDPVRLSELGVRMQQPEPITLTNNNLSPRFAVAWDPWADGRTKVFATWGRYYDKLFLNSVTGEEGPDTLARYYLLDPDGIDYQLSDGKEVAVTNHNLGNLLSKAPPSVRQVDRGLQTPFSDESTFGFEREIASEVALSVRYIRRDFRDQLQDIDVNHSVRTDPATGELYDTLGILLRARRAGGGIAEVRVRDGRPDLFINNSFFNQVLRVGNYNAASYRAIEIELLRRLSRRWQMQGSYVYSRAQGNAEDFQSRVGNDPSVVESEFGYLDYDQRHVVKLNGAFFLPGDWQVGGSASWASGLPYSVVSRFFALDSADYPQYRTRYGYTVWDGNGLKFQPVSRNSERNASVLDLNLSARKSFVIGKTAAAVSLEVFNLLNSDDLRILTYEPNRGEGFDLASKKAVSGPLQIDGIRRFGRRFQIGFQISF